MREWQRQPKKTGWPRKQQGLFHVLDQTAILSTPQCLAIACGQIRSHIRPINASLCPGDKSGDEPVISIGFFLIDLFRNASKTAGRPFPEWSLVTGRVMTDSGYETRVWIRAADGWIVDLCPSPAEASIAVPPKTGFERYFEKKIIRGSVDPELNAFWTGDAQPRIAGAESKESVRSRFEALRLRVADLVA